MIIVLNHKSNLDYEQFRSYVKILEEIKLPKDLIICPNYLNLSYASIKTNLKIGAQNISSYSDGAYTGEISGKQLKSYGVNYAIIGHSERRKNQKENNEEINLKIKQSLNNGITPILCIGETKEEKDKGIIKQVLKEEIEIALKEISLKELNNIIIAYEPIWAIGTGIIPTCEEIEETINYIKTIVPNSIILYGGSVNNDNIETLNKLKCIDGYLIGGLSIKTNELIKFLEKIY